MNNLLIFFFIFEILFELVYHFKTKVYTLGKIIGKKLQYFEMFYYLCVSAIIQIREIRFYKISLQIILPYFSLFFSFLAHCNPST